MRAVFQGQYIKESFIKFNFSCEADQRLKMISMIYNLWHTTKMIFLLTQYVCENRRNSFLEIIFFERQFDLPIVKPYFHPKLWRKSINNKILSFHQKLDKKTTIETIFKFKGCERH